MSRNIRARLVPQQQRRTLEQLTDDLVLRQGDRRSKTTAFWTMLVLSSVIATAGVLTDSTATVIGAMIIAPLSTPIMGLALAAVKGQRNGSLFYVSVGVVLVVAVGVLFSLVPNTEPLADNGQITSRVSPNLMDLVAAVATGLAGAVALARRDVAAVLPGVAIAISLVPPLAVVGVCLGDGEVEWALGALLLFVSNFVALVLAGVFVFTVLGYEKEPAGAAHSLRRQYLKLGALLVLVLVPLGLNTLGVWLVASWTSTVDAEATRWLASEPKARVTGVDHDGITFVIHVESPDELPSSDTLLERLNGRVPSGLKVEVDLVHGETIDVGTVS
ncbi:TIGR00341 family protein [Nocardioides sp.]|uniref:TIGR00341 family protein n=1 Tax=Nocardioides sp. TaxID=35761 RepID=UPI003783E5C3